MKRPDPALLRLLFFGGGLAVVFVLLIAFSDIFLPLLVGFGIAYLLDPVVSWLERKGWGRTWAVVAMTVVLILGLTGFFLYLVPAMGQEFQNLGDRLPQYTQRLRHQVQPLLEKARARYPVEFVELRDRAIETARENLPKLTKTRESQWPAEAASLGRFSRAVSIARSRSSTNSTG
jgi:predicted PurR-regulated permease PerM